MQTVLLHKKNISYKPMTWIAVKLHKTSKSDIEHLIVITYVLIYNKVRS